MSWNDVGTWATLIAVILASNAGIWAVLSSRLERLDEKSDELRTRIDSLDGATLVLLEKRVESLEKELSKVIGLIDELRTVDSAGSKRLEKLERQGCHASRSSWSLLVGAVSDCFSVVQSRLDWHLGWFQRVSEAVDLPHSEGLKDGDVKLQRRLTPRLYELDLCSGSAPRENAAQSLADAAGDHVSLGRLRELTPDFPELLRVTERLSARLAEIP